MPTTNLVNLVKEFFCYRFDFIFKIVLIGDAVSELGTRAITIVSCSSSDVGEDVADAEVCGRHIQPRDHDHHRSRLHRQDPCGEWKHGQATDLVCDGETMKRYQKLFQIIIHVDRDTAGQERFAPIGSMYYNGAKAVIFTYDITRV